jgi:RNA polymerase sigma factor (sigma-70 family)
VEVTRVDPSEGDQVQVTLRVKDQLGALYESEGASATRLAYVLTGDRHAAEDIAHEAFVKVGRKIFGLRDLEHERAYLLRTVVNLVRGRARRKKTEQVVLQKVGVGGEFQQEPDTGVRDEMWSALLQLPVRQRAALFLRYYQDLSEVEAAATLDCSVSAIKSLVSRGLKDLRVRLEGVRDE